MLPEPGWCPWWVAQRSHLLLLLLDQQEHPWGNKTEQRLVPSTQMKSEVATAVVTKLLMKPRSAFSLPTQPRAATASQFTTTGLCEKPPRSINDSKISPTSSGGRSKSSSTSHPPPSSCPLPRPSSPKPSPASTKPSTQRGGKTVRALTQTHAFHF